MSEAHASTEARRAKQDAWRAANRDRVNALARARYAANPDKRRAQDQARRARNPWIVAYDRQKSQAKHRGIPFLLTFEEWVAIWTASGRWAERGARRGCYVMARFSDAGPYAVGNVRICPVAENQNEAHRGKPRMWPMGPQKR